MYLVISDGLNGRNLQTPAYHYFLKSGSITGGTMKSKKCNSCHKIKTLDMFVKDPKTLDGTRNLCKKCFNSQRREKLALKNKSKNDKLKMYNSLCIRECKECKKIKPFDSFVKNNLCNYNIEFLCLKCRNKRLLDWRIKNPEKKIKSDKNWRDNNKEHKLLLDKRYRENNKNKRKEYDYKRRILKRDHLKQQSKEWAINNRDKINKYHRDKKQNDIQYNLSCKLRSRINTALKYKGVKKKLKCLDLLGCSFDELKIYIENKFTEGMSWDKLGRDGIHIDHIKPLAMYDLSDEEQLREACHYTNLQPLWQYDNLSKGAKWIG